MGERIYTLQFSESEVRAIRAFFEYGATRGTHDVNEWGPSPGQLMPYIGMMSEVVRKTREAEARWPATPPAPETE